MDQRSNRRRKLSGGVRTLGGLLALSLAGVATAAPDLLALHVADSVTLIRNGKDTLLQPYQPLLSGDVVQVGARGGVALQLGGAGLISVSSLGEVRVFDTQAGSATTPAMGQFKLVAGAMLVESHRIGRKQLPQDVRLNVGSLKTRIYGATVWSSSALEGDTVCLINGAAEIQITDEADRRLDTVGACLRREPSGLLRNFTIDSDDSLSAAIAATAYGDHDPEATVQPPVVTDAAAKLAIPTKARPAPTIASANNTAAVSAVAASATGWTVVVLSLSAAEPVNARTQSLQNQGLPAITRSASINGKQMYRVTIGQFASQLEALAYAHGPLAKAGLTGWPVPL